MKNHVKGKDGKYHIGGKTFPKLMGSRAQVMHGTAYKTTGGITKEGLKMNKSGRIVSVRASKQAAKHQTLKKKGYLTKKGVFGAYKNGKSIVRSSKKRRSNKTKRRRKSNKTKRRRRSRARSRK